MNMERGSITTKELKAIQHAFVHGYETSEYERKTEKVYDFVAIGTSVFLGAFIVTGIIGFVGGWTLTSTIALAIIAGIFDLGGLTCVIIRFLQWNWRSHHIVSYAFHKYEDYDTFLSAYKSNMM